MINKVEICGVNTTKLPILSNEEKKELLLKIKNGDKDAREKFINGNLRLVLSVVQRFSGRAESADDLFQIGCIGLIKAIDNFDINLNVQFSTYAVPMIIGEIRRYLRDNNSIRVSRSIKDLAYKSIAFKNKFLKENNREPTIEEIAKVVGIKEINFLSNIEFEGALLANAGKTQGIIACNAKANDERKRFTIAHELGHFLIPTHSHNITCISSSISYENRKTFINKEQEANCFASNILVPQYFLKEELKKIKYFDLEDVCNLRCEL